MGFSVVAREVAETVKRSENRTEFRPGERAFSSLERTFRGVRRALGTLAGVRSGLFQRLIALPLV